MKSFQSESFVNKDILSHRLNFTFVWSQVRVEGEQKIAELQAVVEELNGKLGTFTQVERDFDALRLTAFLTGD